MSRESGGIGKLVIKAYSDNKFTSSAGEYTASINPEDIHISSGIDYHLSQGMGSPGTLRYNTSRPKILTFKLLFDNTGIIPGSEAPVEKQLDQLRKVIYDVQENINSPNYVRVIWGIIDFKGRLADLDINYVRFKAEGLPIRAEAFVRVVEEKEAPANLKSSSQATNPSSLEGSNPTNIRDGSTAGVSNAANRAAAGGAAAGAAVGVGTAAGAGGTAAAGTGGAAGAGGTAGTAAASGGSGADAAADQKGKTADAGAQANKAGGAATNNTKAHQVKAGESLPGISKSALGTPNLASSLGKLNGLDSLRGLASGLSLALPFSLGALLAALLAKAAAAAKKGGEWVKDKAGDAKEKVQEKTGRDKKDKEEDQEKLDNEAEEPIESKKST